MTSFREQFPHVPHCATTNLRIICNFDHLLISDFFPDISFEKMYIRSITYFNKNIFRELKIFIHMESETKKIPCYDIWTKWRFYLYLSFSRRDGLFLLLFFEDISNCTHVSYLNFSKTKIRIVTSKPSLILYFL